MPQDVHRESTPHPDHIGPFSGGPLHSQATPCAGETLSIQPIRVLRILAVKLVFVEAPAFTRHRESYLDDQDFMQLQALLLHNPARGDVIAVTGSLRKLRWTDSRRGKGRRGGLRIVYLHLQSDSEIWFFTLYDKNEVADLTPREKALLRKVVDEELAQRERRL